MGIGGISSAEDALEFLIAGAKAIQIGTANFYDPRASENVIRDLEAYCKRKRVDLNRLRGTHLGFEAAGLTKE